MKATDIQKALSAHFEPRQWLLAFEVGNDTGTRQRRWADAVAFNLWPSRGYEIHGIEIKVSKSDLKAELAKPEKSAEVQCYCDHWWLAVPKGLCDDCIIPTTWGVLEVSTFGDGFRVKVAQKAPKLDAKPLTRGFMASFSRRLGQATSKDVEERAEQLIAKKQRDMDTRFEMEVQQRVGRRTKAEMLMDKLSDVLGDNPIDRITGDESFVAAVKVAQALQLGERWGALNAMASYGRDFIAKYDEVLPDLANAEKGRKG